MSIFVECSFENKNVIKSLGCKWDAEIQRWLINDRETLQKMQQLHHENIFIYKFCKDKPYDYVNSWRNESYMRSDDENERKTKEYDEEIKQLNKNVALGLAKVIRERVFYLYTQEELKHFQFKNNIWDAFDSYSD